MTVGEYQIASKAIRENPEDHGYSKEVYETVIAFDNEMKKYIDKYKSSISKVSDQMSKLFLSSKNALSKFEEQLEDTRFVVTHDWFISFNILRNLTIKKTFTVLSNKDKSAFENFVLTTFPSERSNLFKAIYKAIPHREAIITEIETLYCQNHFHAVIVLCYTQVDGICNENLRFGFFDVDQNTKELRVKQLDSNNSLASKIATQLKEPRNEISRYVKNAIKNGIYKRDSFNRHLVMHGHSINYGTKLNAIRAILLLDFVCSLVKEGVITKL